VTDSPAPEPLSPELEATVDEIFGRRDRDDMQPTIDAFLALLAEHPGRLDESIAVLARALAGWPESASLRAFHALGLHAAGRSDGAVGELLALVADAVRTPDVLRYEAALRGNAAHLAGLDAQRRMIDGSSRD